MAFELRRGHVDDFAKLLSQHWELSKKIDKGSTNILIDQIFESISDLIDGRMICGAGGGGFLQVVLKKGVEKARLHERLKEVFQDSDIDVWDSELVWEKLRQGVWGASKRQAWIIFRACLWLKFLHSTSNLSYLYRYIPSKSSQTPGRWEFPQFPERTSSLRLPNLCRCRKGWSKVRRRRRLP